MAPGPRQRLVDSAIMMMRERGVHATGLADLLTRSGTARNSIYQHFPSGKGELMVAATREAGAQVVEFVELLGSRGDAEYVMTKFIGWWIKQVETHDFHTGCPLAAASLAGPEDARVRVAGGEAFNGLRDAIAAVLRNSGIVDGVDTLASLIVNAIEGALIQSQATSSSAPLRDTEYELLRLVRSRMP